MRDRQAERTVSSARKGADDAIAASVKSERNGKRFRVLQVRDGTSSAGRSRAGQRRMGRWDPPPGLFPS